MRLPPAQLQPPKEDKQAQYACIFCGQQHLYKDCTNRIEMEKFAQTITSGAVHSRNLRPCTLRNMSMHLTQILGRPIIAPQPAYGAAAAPAHVFPPPAVAQPVLPNAIAAAPYRQIYPNENRAWADQVDDDLYN